MDKLDTESQLTFARRKALGEQIIALAWGRVPDNDDDRVSVATDAISDILTALLGPAGSWTYAADGFRGEIALDEDRLNEASAIVSRAVNSWEGDAEDYAASAA